MNLKSKLFRNKSIGETKQYQSLTLSWFPPSSEEIPSSEKILGYRVYQGPNSNTVTQLLTELPIDTGQVDPQAPKVSYAVGKDIILREGENVCFAIQAYGESFESDLSQIVCLKDDS